MISWLRAHPSVARGKVHCGSTRQQIKELWDNLAFELNSFGPPTRTSQEWQRVWIHYKSNLKRKFYNNKKCYAETGGDIFEFKEIYLNPIEKSVAELIQLYETTQPSGKDSNSLRSLDQDYEKNNDDTRNCETEDTQSEETQSKEIQSKEMQPKETQPKEIQPEEIKGTLPLPRKATEQERFEALKQQTIQQAEILTTLKRIEKTASENCEVNRNIYELKKRKLLLYQNQCDTANELHSLEVEYKRKKLQLLEAQLAKYQ